MDIKKTTWNKQYAMESELSIWSGFPVLEFFHFMVVLKCYESLC